MEGSGRWTTGAAGASGSSSGSSAAGASATSASLTVTVSSATGAGGSLVGRFERQLVCVRCARGLRVESGRCGRLAGFGRRGGDHIGGLVGDWNAGGFLGRLVIDRGNCLGLRRGPARLLFGQDLSPMVGIRPQ